MCIIRIYNYNVHVPGLLCICMCVYIGWGVCIVFYACWLKAANFGLLYTCIYIHVYIPCLVYCINIVESIVYNYVKLKVAIYIPEAVIFRYLSYSLTSLVYVPTILYMYIRMYITYVCTEKPVFSDIPQLPFSDIIIMPCLFYLLYIQ